MKKLIAIVALLFMFGGTAAIAAAVVAWPAACSGWTCANSHMNDLNTRLKGLNNKAFSKTVVVEHPYTFDLSDPTNVPFISIVTPCGTPDPTDDRPFKGVAISGGITISDDEYGVGNADQWHIVSSGPPNMMNSWPVFATNPDYVDGDPLPIVTTYAICLT
jgi:hypothetical protein